MSKVCARPAALSRPEAPPKVVESKGYSLDDLLRRAADKRRAAWGETITYSRKVFIPLTNLCRDSCGYCVFAQPPDSPSARYLTPDEVLTIAREGRAAGCKEALFSLGERPELRYGQAMDALKRLGYVRTVDYLRDMCERVLTETGLLPHANPGTLTEDEMRMLRPVTAGMGMMLESTSARLMEKGQAHYLCPDKIPEARLRTIETAGRLNVPFTTGILIGIGETWEERMDSLQAIESLNREYGHIQEVIIQNFRAKPAVKMSARPEPGLTDMLRTIAAARLILSSEISVQAPPNLQPDEFGRYIDAGINDWGGISPVTPDHINPEKAWPRIPDLRRITESHGCRLRERLAVYPRHLTGTHIFLSPEIRPTVESLAGPDGLAADQCPS